LASPFRLLFSSQFHLRWSTTRLSGAQLRFLTHPSTDDARFEHHPHLCRRRCLPGERRNLSRCGPPWPSRQRGRRPIHPGTAGSPDRACRGRFRDGCADDWIAERAGKGDIVITADIPLASRCVKAGAEVIAPNGKPFTEQSIGMTLAVRNLMTDLRSSGEVTGGPRSFAPRDRSAFLSALDQTIRRIQRQRAVAPAQNQN
jgi:hypothetical protein